MKRNASDRIKKQYIEVPLPMDCGAVKRLWHKMVGILLLPCYLIAARILGAPGVALHVKCAWLAVRLFFLGRLPLRTCYSLICQPMDSTRYFEFHEVLKSLAHLSFSKYLDVSSPRLVPLLLLIRNKDAVSDMMNPDKQDIRETESLAVAFGLRDRCIFSDRTIEEKKYAAKTFDLITCISVLEHIPADSKALRTMWSLLRPGGRLILTLPCMSQPLEQFISLDDYGVLPPGTDGYTFWQRYYDEERLQSIVFNITGKPVRMAVYGERTRGLFYRNANMKRLLGPLYPFCRESYMMAKEYRYFRTIAELPGEGVVMLEFVKS